MSQINSNTKDDFQVVLLLSCFVGHPVVSYLCAQLAVLYTYNCLLILIYYKLKHLKKYQRFLASSCKDILKRQ